jgi:hypothetical protein
LGVPGTYLGLETGYPDWGFSRFIVRPSRAGQYLNLGHASASFPVINSSIILFSTLYDLSYEKPSAKKLQINTFQKVVYVSNEEKQHRYQRPSYRTNGSRDDYISTLGNTFEREKTFWKP